MSSEMMYIKSPVEELKETRLFQILSDADPVYAGYIIEFVAGVAPVLATTVRHFPYYTRHDAHHGYNVVRRIEQVVKPDCLAQNTPISFEPSEIFLLIAASYAHDLGMTVFPGEEDALLDRLGVEKFEGWETDPKLQDELRSKHSQRGGKFIEENADAIGLPRPLVSALDKMMRAHNLVIADLNSEFQNPYAAQAKEIDVLQLAVLVCVADALEFSDTRVIAGVIEKIERDPSEVALTSYRENMKHICVGGSLAIRDDGSVLVSGTFSDAEVLALAHHTFDDMQHWVQEYCDVDRRSKRPRFRVRPEPFARTLDFSQGHFERLGIRLNKRNVIDLIASNAVWRDNRGIAIRELVQNAVEACLFRQHNSSKADSYDPIVKVTFDRSGHSITVSDNGCGMSERIVLNNFLTVGSSRAREPGYANTGHDSIARFGIGFWSVFTIAEHARIGTAEFEPYRGRARTGTAKGFSFNVSLEELKDYTVFSPIERPYGTTVTLILDPDVIIDDVYTQGVAMIMCSVVPLTFTLDGVDVQVPREVPDVSVRDVMGERGRLMDDQGVQLFQWRGEANDIEVALGIAYRMDNGRATFLTRSSLPLSLELGNYRFPKIGVCGFITRTVTLKTCVEIGRIGQYFANHKNPSGFEFTLDRQSLQDNRKFQEFTQGITDLINIGYRAFLLETNSQDASTVALLQEQAAMRGGNVYDAFTGIELMNAADKCPDLFSFRLYPVSIEKEFEEVVPSHLDLVGLQKLTGKVFFMQRQPEKASGFNEATWIDLEGLPDGRGVPGPKLTYDIVRRGIAGGTIDRLAYVMTANRLGSMLFDADPNSSVRFERVDPFGITCIQFADFGRISFDAPPTNILAEVQGKWAGAIYARQFTTPYGKPYVFLGRYRVLIAKFSKLATYISQLAAEKKVRQISGLIADLKEDEVGYTPAAIIHLL